MCRIFFSPAGIHFEDLELCRPLSAEGHYQPLFCCTPCTSVHEGHDYPAGSFVLAQKYGDRSARHSDNLSQRLTSSLPKRSSPLPSVTVTGQSPEVTIASSMKNGVGSPPRVNSDVRRHVSTSIATTHVGDGSPESAKLRPSKSRQKHRQITAGSNFSNVKSSKSEQEGGEKERGSPALQRSREKKVRFSNIVEERSISSNNSSDESSIKSQSSCTDLPAAEEHSSTCHPCWTAKDTILSERLSKQQPDSMTSKESGSDASAMSGCSEWLSQCESSRGYADDTSSPENPITASCNNDDTESNTDYQGQRLEGGQSYQLRDRPTLNPRHNTFENTSPFDLREPAYVILS